MSAEQNYTTVSGVTIPESDRKAIQKESSKETIRNGLALIGVGAVIVFVRNKFNLKNVPLPTILE